MSNAAIELKGITKRFGSITANKNISMTVNKGEILSILGENGSGKTTLMNMLSGIYHPDEGQIFVDGKEASIQSPKDAFKYKIGMIHQHFKLVDILTVTEEVFGLFRCEYRCRLVENKNLRTAIDNLDDFYSLLFRY